MFTTWLKKKGTAATYDVLGKALVDSGRTDLGQKFLEEDSKRRQFQFSLLMILNLSQTL